MSAQPGRAWTPLNILGVRAQHKHISLIQLKVHFMSEWVITCGLLIQDSLEFIVPFSRWSWIYLSPVFSHPVWIQESVNYPYLQKIESLPLSSKLRRGGVKAYRPWCKHTWHCLCSHVLHSPKIPILWLKSAYHMPGNVFLWHWARWWTRNPHKGEKVVWEFTCHTNQRFTSRYQKTLNSQLNTLFYCSKVTE